MLIVDETGFLKKGTKSCGVARQYSGTAGRIENSPIGVFLGYVTPKARALLAGTAGPARPGPARPGPDQDWAADTDRRTAAGVPKAVGFATTIVLARRMIDRAVAAGVPARWVTADAVYGSDSRPGDGRGARAGVRGRRPVGRRGVGRGHPVRMPGVLAGVPADGWSRVSCGPGAKGPRAYDWAVRPVNAPDPKTYARWVLIRRSVSDPSDVAFFACGGPPGTTLAELARVAGSRWAIEECFELGKGCCGLDEYEVRSWAGWHRHVTLSLFALAVVAVIRSREAVPTGGKKGARIRSR